MIHTFLIQDHDASKVQHSCIETNSSLFLLPSKHPWMRAKESITEIFTYSDTKNDLELKRFFKVVV